MDKYPVGSIWVDAKGELYMRVYDPFGKFPWMFLNPLESGEPAERRVEDFPHKPLKQMRVEVLP